MIKKPVTEASVKIPCDGGSYVSISLDENTDNDVVYYTLSFSFADAVDSRSETNVTIYGVDFPNAIGALASFSKQIEIMADDMKAHIGMPNEDEPFGEDN